jgi:3-methyladenine DNA glycosylase Mpg
MHKITTSGGRSGISIDQEDGNMPKITTSGRRIGISINQEDGNMHKITTSGRRIGISIDRPRRWQYAQNNHLREKDWN